MFRSIKGALGEIMVCNKRVENYIGSKFESRNI